MSPQPKKQESDSMVSTEQHDAVIIALQNIRQELHDLKTSLVGDEQLGHRGLVTRMTFVERAILVLAFACVLMGGERVIKLLLG